MMPPVRSCAAWAASRFGPETLAALLTAVVLLVLAVVGLVMLVATR